MRWDLLWALDSASVPSHVEGVDLTSFDADSLVAWGQVEQFVLSLLGEVKKSGPLRLDLIGGLSETSALVRSLAMLDITSLIGALSLLLPLLALTGHLWSLHTHAYTLLVLDMLSLKLCLVHILTHGLLLTSPEVALLTSCGFLISDHAELAILSSCDELTLLDSARLLLLLHDCLSRRDK